MRTFLRSAVGAVGMGLTWAAGWALVGAPVKVFVDPMESLVDMWILALTTSSFVCGAVFFTALGIADGHRRFDVLSLPDSCVPYTPEFEVMAQAEVA